MKSVRSNRQQKKGVHQRGENTLGRIRGLPWLNRQIPFERVCSTSDERHRISLRNVGSQCDRLLIHRLPFPLGRGHADFLSPEARLFVFMGLLGGFTTFSTFSNETMSLWQAGDSGAVFANIAVHVVLGLGAAWLGHALAYGIWG